MLSLRVIAGRPRSKSNAVKRKKVTTRNTTFRSQLRNMSTDEQKKVQDVWKIYKDFFVDEETLDVITIPESCIDDFFDGIR